MNFRGVMVVLAGGGFAAALAAAPPLPNLRVDPSMTTVSGLSSGGYMAVQLHVAHSATFARGAGVIAAGPWYCAEGSALHATGRCLFAEQPLDVAPLQARARQWAQQGAIDPLEHLQRSRVYLFGGRRDTAVRPPLVSSLARWYAGFVPAAQIVHRDDVDAEHGMVTDDFGNPCAVRGMPYVQNCGVDVAGELLAHLYGPLAPRAAEVPRERLAAFDQREFIGPGRGMGPEGRLVVPEGCAAGGCRLHVVLHGCGQNLDDLGETYVRDTGYNRWAETNRIVVLYPQTSPQALNSCWDWWGYTGADYATRRGEQVAAIKAMADRLAGAAERCVRAFNATHAWAARAVWSAWGRVVARGSLADLGWPWQTSALRETAPGHFAPGGC